ncbi:type II secretion system F family protein [Yersinia artesiana]|uniref:type II secretion system F family protein n=1 Tax=Yersinia artesiana TaxID=2890315 RepID=UPI001583BEFB|nr:type II secretion system F family protein [Yersinia artesiana]
MPVYNYAAINNKGVKIKGSVEAENALIARQIIYQKKLYLLNIKMKRISRFARWMISLNTMNHRDLVLITRQMSILINAAIPLDEALVLIENQHTKSKVDSVIHKIREKILEGHSLSDSLSQFPVVFNSLYRSMIAAGELSGHLGLVLSNLADHIEQVRKVKSKIIQTLIYPAILVSISIGVIVILLTLVIPNIIEQFASYDQALPLSTRALMATSHWVKDNILFITAILVISLLGLYGMSKVRKINMFFEYWYLKLPMLGNLILKVNISRYLKMMEILTSNGVNLIRAMGISTSVVTNLYIKQRLDNAVMLVSEGDSFSSSLSISRVFSPMTIHMIASGERSGELDAILKKIADMQEQEIIEEINIFVILLEPVILLFMAAFIFFIVLAIFQPILEINNLIF